VRLLHASAADMYDRFVGGRERALRVIERAFAESGNIASADCVWVAEVDGQIAAAMAAFPVEEASRRSRAFLLIALRGSPVWRWPGALRLYHAGGRAAPSPPASAFYVDALATDPRMRRRGAARALLGEAERQARRLELPSVALETGILNAGARSLYARAGYDEVASREAARGLPGFVALVKRLD
jgi:ribosomal protein S18 acetylase RimI-like enzyme